MDNDKKWLNEAPTELSYYFHVAINDGLYKSIEDIPKEDAVNEAKYILSCYSEGGHTLNEALTSDDEDIRHKARRGKRQLEDYIERFDR